MEGVVDAVTRGDAEAVQQLVVAEAAASGVSEQVLELLRCCLEVSSSPTRYRARRML